MMRRALLLVLVVLGAMCAMPADARSVWLIESGALTRVEIDTGSVRAAPTPQNVRDIAPVNNDMAWVLTDRALVRVDATLSERARADIDPAEASAAGPLAADPNSGGVWVAIEQRLVNFDATGQRIHDWPVAEAIHALAVAGPEAIFVTSGIALTRYDLTGAIVARIDLSALPGSSASALLVDPLAGYLWLVRSGALVQFDVLTGLRPRASIALPAPDALALEPIRGVLTTITEREIARYDRDGKLLAPTSFASELLIDLAGIEAQLDRPLLWFGDRLSVGAIDLGSGVVLRVPETDTVSRFIGSPLQLEPQLDLSTPEEAGNPADTLVVFKYGALCDEIVCQASAAYLRGLRLEAYLGNRSVSGLFIREMHGEGSSGRVPVPRWQSSEPLRAWLTDAYGNRSDTATLTWPIDGGGTGGKIVAQSGSPPTITITSPLNNATYTAPATVTIKTTATPGTGATVTKVEFFSGATLLGTVTTSPYNLTWSNVQVGSYSLTAKITDSLGATATSTAIAIAVNAGTKATPIAAYLLNEAWTSPGVVADAGGTHNGAASGTVSAVVAPASAPKPDTCKAGSFGGGVVDVSALPVSVAAGAKTTLAFWMYWTGTDAVMPAGWVTHDLLFSAGSFGFSTLNSDVYGIASAGLANTWHHVVAEFTNGNVAADKIYLDGVPQTLTQRAGAPNNINAVVATSLRIGGLSGSASYRFAGKLDEIKVFNRALTATEVSAEFAAANACGTAPTVTLTAPANNTIYVAPATIPMTATAAATGTTLTKVEFYNGATLLGTDTTSPYAYTWSNVAVGTYSLTARATDAKGMVTTSTAASVQVKANVLPTVALTSPANNSTFVAPATISLAATASDSDGTVTKVDFYQGATKLATVTTAPYTYTWTNVAGGNYALTAKATDDKGAVTTSVVVNVKVNKPPTVSITAPANNAVIVLPATITINASASDPDGTISKVEFYRDGVLLGTDTTSPYSYAWTNATPGTYVLTAKATDNLGAVTTSAAVTITTKANQPPTVSITSPANGANFVSGVPVTITATAADADGSITKVEFYADYGTKDLLGTDTTAPYTITTQSLYAIGNNVLTAVATDNKGATTTSAPVTVTVTQNQYPTITLTAPVDGQIFISPAAPPDITLAAAASDSDGRVVAVRFYKQALGPTPDPNPVLLGTVTNAPYQAIWPSVPYTGSEVSSYWVWAEATDDAGAVSASTIANIEVLQATPRTVRITSPGDNPYNTGGAFPPPATIVLTAVTDLAVSTDPVAKVEFIADGTVVGTVTSANGSNGEYVSVWRNVPAGTKIVTARLTDIYNSSVTSDVVTVQVATPPPPPTITLQAPTNAQLIPTYAGAADVPLSATVADPNGTVSHVDFIADYRLVARVTSAPYSATWAGAPAGVHAVWAEAADTRGNLLAASAPAYIDLPLFAHPTLAVLTSPSPTGSYTTSTPVTLTVEALSFGYAIAQVEFFEGPYLLKTLTKPPWTMAYTFSAGQQTVYAVVYVPFAAAVATTPVTFNVSGSGATASVSLTSPAEGQQFYAPASIPLAASVNDPGGIITQVIFYSGSQQIGTATHAPYSATWNNVSAGNYTLSALGVSATGNITSAPVHVTVATNTAPNVTITAPTSGQSFFVGAPISILVNVSDPDGNLKKVDFYANGTLLGTATTTPYSLTWSNATAGSYSLTAIATDTAGATTTSVAIPITVNANAIPTVALVLPRDGGSFAAGGTINLIATAADPDGSIARIDFYAGSTFLGSVASPPYTLAWTSVPAGSYALTAKAVDNRGAVTSSAAVNVTVQTLALNITTPVNGASVPADFVLVQGTYTAPPNSGVTVNGVVAHSDGHNFFINNFPLVPGANTLTLTLTTADGQTVTRTQTVTSTQAAPMQVYAEPDADFAPATYTIRLTNRTANPITNIAYPNLGGGQLDTTGVGQDMLGKISYATPGVYTPGFVITDSVGNTYTQTVAILVKDKAALDQMLKTIWVDFTSSLARGDKAAAMRKLSGQAQMKYGSVFDALAPYMGAIVSSFAGFGAATLSDDIAEYVLSRKDGPMTRLYFIYYLQDDHGIWSLDSL